MGAVIIAARNVPRPPIDDPWGFWKQQDNGIAPVLLPKGGGFPFVPSTWYWHTDESSPWTFWKYEGISVGTPYMPAGGGFPFKPNFSGQKFGGDDSSGWTVESFPRPAVAKLVGGGFPFLPNYAWQQRIDDPGFWQNESVGPNLNLELASNLPPAKAHWTTGYDDASGQNQVSRSVNLNLSVVASAPFFGATHQFNNDDGAVWYTRPGAVPQQNLPPPPAISMAGIYIPNPPIDDVTGRVGPVNNGLLNPTISAPNIPGRWKLDLDDGAVWYTRPGSVPLGNLPVITALTMASVYIPNPDDSSVWRPASRSVNRLIDLAVVIPPLIPSRWKLDFNESAVWYTRPGAVPLENLPVLPKQVMAGVYVPNPPIDDVINRYGFTNALLLNSLQLYAPAAEILPEFDEAAVWQKKSFGPSLLLELVTNLPTSRPPYWPYNLDWSATWNSHPVPANEPLLAVVAGPLPISRPPYGRWDYDQSAFWVGSPLNVSINITQPGPPIPTAALEWILRARRRHNR